MFVNMLVTFFNIGLWFFDIITTIMCLFMGGEDGFYYAFIYDLFKISRCNNSESSSQDMDRSWNTACHEIQPWK